jgi:hypothetical protein
MDNRQGAGRNAASASAYPEWNRISALVDDNQQATGSLLRSFVVAAQEIGTFAQLRLQEDIATWPKLIAARDAMELVDCQQRFLTKAAEQYVQESVKLLKIMTSALEHASARSPAGARPQAPPSQRLKGSMAA